jgi:DNA-binding transcriptional ArsR family regulator/predicted transcriptional regulator
MTLNTNRIAEIGALVGEPARAAMLAALMDGRALTATELALVSQVTPQTASSHLARLTSVGLLAVTKQGRHRYHRLASPAVARMLEGIMQIATTDRDSTERRRTVVGPRDVAMRLARTCYDHLAGRLGVAIAETMVARGLIEFEDDGGQLTDRGARFLGNLGIALPESTRNPRSSRPLCRPCLDWSERRHHVAGKVGATICAHLFEEGWIRRLKDTRALEITPKGRLQLRRDFQVTLDG